MLLIAKGEFPGTQEPEGVKGASGALGFLGGVGAIFGHHGWSGVYWGAGRDSIYSGARQV